MTDPTLPTDQARPSSNGPAKPAGLPQVPDLPPVEAPTAGFIVQLFVIPAVVVLVVILVWLLFGKLAGGERDAMEYIRLIRASDTNERAANRAAFELASLIQNDTKLAHDPRLLAELTEMLEHDLDRVDNPELTEFVALALGRFQTLEAVSKGGNKVDPLAALARAVRAPSPDNVRAAAAISLAQQAAREEGAITDVAAVSALGESGKTGAPTLRRLCTFALGFFGGDAATEALHDRLNDDDRDTRYNAAAALGRRGDPAAMAILREMLSTGELVRTLADATPTERQSRTEALQTEALRALDKSLEAGKPDLARKLRAEVEALTRSDLATVRSDAQSLLKKLQPSA